MIWESSYWKDSILREARGLRKRKAQRRWAERSLARLEQSVMVGFYAIRKLLESKKLSRFIESRSCRVERFKSSGKIPNFVNWHHIDRFFDLSAPEITQKSVKFLCDQFIHSYVFMASASADGLDGVFVSSDRERNRYLYFVPIDEIVRTFESVGKDYPSRVQMTSNARRSDFDVLSHR